MQRVIGSFAICLFLLGGTADAERFTIDPDSKETLVRFVSKAPLETFEGLTSVVTGYARVNPLDMRDSVDIRVDVDLASFDTGLALRDRHMKENHLETDLFPLATFAGGALIQPHADKLMEGRKHSFEVEGEFTLHGVTRPVVLPVEVTLSRADGRSILHITGRFELKLSDYGIARPKFLIMKLNDTQIIEVHLVALSETGKQQP